MNKSKKSLVVSIALATSMVASAFSAFAYTDVASTDWFSEAVTNMSNKGLVNGYEDGTFLPNNNITRAEVAKILTTYFNVTVSTQEEMSDVPAGAWYADVMRRAVGAGYFKGDSGSDVVTYRPEANITRQEACVTVYRAFNWEPSGASNFADNGDIADWAKNAIATLVDKGVIKGYEDNTFLPTQNITRAEFCKLFDAAMKVGTGTGTIATPVPGTIGGSTTSSSGHSSSGGGGTGTSPATAAPSTSKPTATPDTTATPEVTPTASPDVTATPAPITDDEKEIIASMAPTEEEQKAIDTKVEGTINDVANSKNNIDTAASKKAEEKIQAAVDAAVTEQKDEKVQAAVEEKTAEEVDKLVAAKAEETGKTVEEIKADATVMEEINKTAADTVEEQKAVIEEEVVKAITEETTKAVEATAKAEAEAEAEAEEAAKLASSFTYNDIYDALRSYNSGVISGETTANVNQIVDVKLVEALGETEKTKEAVNSPLYAYAMIKAQNILDSEAAKEQKTALMATMVEMIEGTSEQLISMVKDGKDLASSESRTVLIDYVRNTLFPKVEAKLTDEEIVSAVQTIARQTALDLLANTGAVEYIQGRGADVKAADLRYAYLKFVANMSDEDIAKDAYADEFVK